MPHLFPLLLTTAHPLLLQATNFTRSEIITLGVAGLGVVYFVLNRINVVRDRRAAKREAVQEAAVKARAEAIKKLQLQADEQHNKNLQFQQQIEHLNDVLGPALAQLKTVDDTSRDNKQKIESVKDALGRIEAQLATLLGSLLTQRP